MSKINANETREERFKRIASRRTQRILNDLRLLGNCSNRMIYKYGDDEVAKIFRAVESELKRIKTSFSHKTNKNQFSL